MQVCFNGIFYGADEPLLTAHNRSFKYGDGVFETAKVFNGKLLLADLHFERLFISLKLLQIQTREDFSSTNLQQLILELCEKNDCLHSARVRLAAYRTADDFADYLIEAIPLHEKINSWAEEGLTITIYPYARKSTDVFASIKSANYLPYIMAAKFAVEKGVDDALVLNSQNNIADSSKANIFFVKGNIVFTPPLHQGCVNGVMRRTVMEVVKRMGFKLKQQEVTIDDIKNADEIFLTNALQIIRWVKQYEDVSYTFIRTKEIFENVLAAIF